MEESKVQIDESLYSRQEIMLGKQAMQKMALSNVFISGLGGLGVEIAKNVALAGVKILTIHDTKNTTYLDLSTQFYLSSSDIGKNRAEVSLHQISELNPYVKYSVSQVDLNFVDLSFLDQYKCIILTDTPLSTQIRINDYCHKNGKSFISADVRGAFTWIFCDFGDSFEIHDKDGEENKEVLIGEISKTNPGVVKTLDKDIFHGFESGDLVTFRELKGMAELNGTVHKIKVINPCSFTIGDTTKYSDFTKGSGIAQQVKEVFKVNFKSLKESIADPNIILCDFSKMTVPLELHLGMQALHAFYDKNKRLTSPWNSQDAEELIHLAKSINESSKNKLDEINLDILKQLSFTAQGSIVGLSAFTGGIVAQECLKSLSGKYTPLMQWLYLDVNEIIPPLNSDPSNFQPEEKRTDAQVIVLGKEVTQKLADSKLFMVGCGAIGCEMLKNFAMLGVATGSGLITVTDNDLIEKSNLNRQFLFRPKDISHPKSESAASATIKMNPTIKIKPFQDKVGPDTEQKYSDEFFAQLDFVVNALDNVNARLYVDSRCVTTTKPLLESGTLGPKGHVQVILPHQTESYGSQRDPPEKDVPFCTLKSFPNQIEHCIEWARDFSFGGMFFSKPMQWKQLIEEEYLLEKLNEVNGGGIDLKIVRTGVKIIRTRPKSFEDCIRFARLKFESYYVNKAKQLLHNFPLDHVTDDKGSLFWSSPKRPPKEIQFNFSDPFHQTFIIATASLLAEVWGLPRYSNLDKIKEVLNSVSIPEFIPKSTKKIETDEKVKKSEEVSIPEEDITFLLKELHNFFSNNKQVFKLKPIEFEKDDDTNFHIDFISATANLRARMYSIPEVERLKIKAIAGRIMPAIATTTAAVSGLVSIELIKLVERLSVEKFKNLFMNLALPFWSLSEPGPPEKKKIGDTITYTLWDRWNVKEGDITLDQFMKYFESKYNSKVGGVFNGPIMIYVPLFPGHAKRKQQKMSTLLKRKPTDKYCDLIITFTDSKGEDISGPPVRYYYDK